MVTEKQIKLARDKFKEISGITIYTPDEGTLDDFEQSRYDGLVAALEAALWTDAEPVAQLLRIDEMMDEGEDDGSPILPAFDEGWSVEAKVEACLHLLEKRRDVIEGFTAKENWRDDPAQDERWNAGLDFAMTQLCKVLKVDPQSINWDCATETLEGDAQSQIHKVLAAAPPAPSMAVKALQMADETFRDLGWHDKYEATTAALAALSAQVQDVAESGYSLVQIKAAYIAGYAQGNCLSGTLEGEEEWEEYFSCVVDTAYPASKHRDAE